MFKIARVSTSEGLVEADKILKRIYSEAPQHWPHGLTRDHFDGGLYLIREKQSNAPAGFVGWQERLEPKQKYPFLQKVGYYSIGVLPEYRRNGFAREAVAKLIQMKSAGVDKVRALIMSSNKPSQELAKDLGVEMQIKQATSLLQRVMSSLRPTTKGIFGPRTAQLARDRGVSLFYPKDWFKGSEAWHLPFNDRLSRMGLAEKFVTGPGSPDRMGVLMSPSQDKIPTSLVNRADMYKRVEPFPFERRIPGDVDVDKLYEPKLFGKFMPKTRALADLLPQGSGNVNRFLETMSRRMGPQWLIKPRAGWNSGMQGFLTDESSWTPERLRRLNPQNWIAQTRADIAPVNPVADAFEHLGGYGGFGKEFRVHAVGNKVLPHATFRRGPWSASLPGILSPFKSRDVALAEQHVQRALDSIPPQYRQNRMYGFDVAIDKNGRPFIIESNASHRGGASGYLSNPLFADALQAGIKGQLPNYVRARNALYGTALAGGGYGAAQALKPEPPSFWERLTGRRF